MNFNELLQEIDIELSEYQLKQFNDYYHFLVEYNEKVNLTAITEKEDVYLKHFIDSGICLCHEDINGKVISIHKNHAQILRPYKIKGKGGDIVDLCIYGKYKSWRVYTLVKNTFGIDLSEYEGYVPLKNFENLYLINKSGNIISLGYGIINSKIKEVAQSDSDGYLVCTLAKNGITKQYYIHRLVAETFIDNPNNLPYINHKDENKYNNKVDNLEWCTHKYNIQYSLGTKIECYDFYTETTVIYPSAKECAKNINSNYKTILQHCENKKLVNDRYVVRYG